MVSISKRNKRTSLHQKYKVAKKVRQHHKKAKQALKKQKPKKDKPVSIPMEVPFKADILKGVEDAKLQEKIMQKKRLVVLDKLKNKVKVNELDQLKSKLLKDPTKSYISENRKLLEKSNVVIQVLDARDPNGTRSLEVEKEVKLLNKPLVIVLNKIDLVSVDNLNSWMQHLSKEAKVIPFKSSIQNDDTKFKSELKFQKKTKPGNVYGADDLKNYLLSLMKGSEEVGSSIDKIIVGVIGLPNTGKSSVINSLKGKRVCIVGECPYVTRSLQSIDINDKITIIDSPSLVLSKGNTAGALTERNCINVKSIADPVTVAEHIFNRCNKLQLQMHYALVNVEGYEKFIVDLAKANNLFKKGGVPNINDAARYLFNDWNSGRIAHWTLAPTDTDTSSGSLSEAQQSDIKRLSSKYVTGFAGFSVIEGSGQLKAVIDCAEIEEDDSDNEESNDEDCDGCDDDDCEGCSDGSEDDGCDMDE